MNYYSTNMECIMIYRTYIYNLISKYDKKEAFNDETEVLSEETFNHESALYICKKGCLYRLNSMYDPSFEADQWVKQYSFNETNNIVVMYGLGNGVFLRSILRKLHKKDIIIVYEPSAKVFFHVLNYYDMTDIIAEKRLLFTTADINDKEFHLLLREVMNATNIKTVIICSHPFYNEIFDQECVRFWKDIKDSYSATITDLNTQVHFGEIFIDNILKNIEFLKESNSLPDIKLRLPTELPAILVAAGPSVEKNIEKLKQAKGKAVIFAVDRILDYLLDSGIEPDFVVTLDPAKPLEYFTKRDGVKIPLISFMQTSHKVLEHHKGKKIICNCSAFLNKAYINNKKEVPQTLSSGSVATVTFSVCINLGFKTIILVGQDLAYDGKITHAGNVQEFCGEEKDVTVEDIYGRPIKSRYDWKNFIIWYQDTLEQHRELTVIDAKQAGAKIKGTIVMPLEEAIKKYCKDTFNPEGLIKQLPPTFNKDELQRVKEYLEKNLQTLGIIRRKAREAVKLCDYLMDEYKKNGVMSPDMNTAAKKVIRINHYISNQQLYTLIDKYVMSSSIQEISELFHFTDNVREDNIKTYERAKNVFEAIIESLIFIKPRLEEAVSRLI